MEKLKACPFCGCDKVKMFYDERQNYHVECYGCGKTVSFHIAKDSSWKKAIENYNLRAAPENKPLTMEELRRMDGEPVFAIPLNKNADWIEHWEILRKDIVTANSISTKGRMYFLYLKDYGKTWLAYARKPEGSEKV